MSMILMAKAMNIRVGNPIRKLVLMKLADNANDQGECWPSYQHISDHCECSKSAVRTHIDALIDMGFVSKTNRLGNGNGKGNASNIYLLNLDNSMPSESTPPMLSESTPPMPSESTPMPSESTPPMPSESTPMPSESTPPMPSDGTRTSHSFEPVKEPFKRSSCPEATQPDEDSGDESSGVIFTSRHPDAVVFSAKKRQWGTQDDLTCAKFIWEKIITMYECAAETDYEIVRPKEPNWVVWSNEVRLMVAQDGRTHKQICSLFKRANQDRFWCKNVLSPAKLREKWDELTLKLSPASVGASDSDKSINHLLSSDWNTADGWENVL